MQEVWAERADAAEGAIVSRHLRRCGECPGQHSAWLPGLLFDASGCSTVALLVASAPARYCDRRTRT